MTFSQVQRDADMHDDAVQLAMREQRPMGYLGDSWSGGRKRGEYNVLGLGQLASLWCPPSSDADLEYR